MTASDAEWVLEIEAGDSLSPADRFWATHVVGSEDGILVVGETDTATRTNRLLTWFRQSGGDWIEGEITPQGGAAEFEPWIVSAAPEGFLIAGMNSAGDEGPRQAASLIGDGVQWELVADDTTGLPAIVTEVMPEDCLCGWIRSVMPFDGGYVAVGSNANGEAVAWSSGDGETWSEHVLGPTGYWGMVGVATLDDVAYAFGAAPDPAVWRSTDGETWEVVADETALGLDADSTDKVGMLGMVADEGRLYALVSLDLPFGDEECPPPIEDCDTPALALLTSDDGTSWERVPLPEAIRWIDRTASIASFDGRVHIGTDANDMLLVWSTEDPTAVVVPPPDEQPSPEREPFVAVRIEPNRRFSDVPAHLRLEPYSAVPRDWEPLLLRIESENDEHTTQIRISDGYVIDGDVVTPTSEPRLVTLTYGATFDFTVEVAAPPLGVGLHVFELDVPVWIGEEDPQGRDPDVTATIRLSYNVFDEERIAEIKGFCDVVLRFQGGPDSVGDLEVFDELAAEYLDGDLLERAETASAKLRSDIESGSGYYTSEIVGVIGDACGRYDLESIGVAY